MKATTTTIEMMGTTYKVYNKTPSRKSAIAIDTKSNKRLQIDNCQEVLNLANKNDLETRIIAAQTTVTTF